MLEGGTFQDFAKLNFWVCQKKGRNHDICLLCDKSAYCINKMCPLTEQCAPYHGSRGMKIPQPGAKRPPKLSRVTSGYGGLKIPLGQIRLTPKNGGYMGVA